MGHSMGTTRITGVRRMAGILGAAAIAAALLSGCSALSGLNSVASCSRLATAGSDLKEALSGLGSQVEDPAAALATVTKATDAFASEMKDVRDQKVKTKAAAVTSALRTFAADLKAAGDAPSPDAATALDDDKTAVLDAAQAAKAVCE